MKYLNKLLCVVVIVALQIDGSPATLKLLNLNCLLHSFATLCHK